jgi:hypothetical protein
MYINCAQNSMTTNDFTVNVNFPCDGYLFGTGDVIYVRAWQPANREMGVVLWPDNSSDDFDVFVNIDSGNIRPTPYLYDYRGIEGTGKNELVIIPAASASRWVYIAIGSYSGTGQFRFYANIHESDYPQTIYTSTNFAPTADQKAQIRKLMRKLAQAVYFGTDGRHFISNFEMYWNATPPVDNYLRWQPDGPNHAGGVSNCSGSTGYAIYSPANWCSGSAPHLSSPCTLTSDDDMEFWAGDVGLHEFAHVYYKLDDEYHSTGNCGHTLMAARTNARKAYLATGPDFCAYHHGGKDPVSGTTGHSQLASNWMCIHSVYNHALFNVYGSGPWPTLPEWTPDRFYRTESHSSCGAFCKRIIITEH